MPKPTYVYKLMTRPPNILLESLPLSDLDSASGFIHLSTSLQVPGTLQLFFANDPRVYVLRISYDHIEKNIKWEDSKGESSGEPGIDKIFPHLYNGGKLGKDEIESVSVWENDVGWDKALDKAMEDLWLIY